MAAVAHPSMEQSRAFIEARRTAADRHFNADGVMLRSAMADDEASELSSVKAGLTALQRQLASLHAMVARFVESQGTTAGAADLLTATMVDRLYRLQKGTAAAFAKTGRIKHALRHRGGRDSYLIPRAAADEQWGAQ